MSHPLPPHRTCGTAEVHHRLLERRLYQQHRIDIELFTSRFQYFGGADRRTGVTVIPTVVHALYKDDAANIADAQVHSQIDVLNQDFRAANPDRAKVPDVWSGVTGDARIEFKLETVTRTRTQVDAFTTDDAMKATATGGIDPWDTERYLNIWVCELSGGLLGYAQFPGGPPETDGVVVWHRAFGANGTASAPFHFGRTATHEVGHWLNLFHIWGDRLDCRGTDEVVDTPTQQAPNYGKPTFPKVSCNNAPNGDMFMNYMDYVDDEAMYMFTQGQVVRMQAALDGPRAAMARTTT